MGCLVAKVAIAKAIYAIDKPYDYLVPKELEETLRPGMRVLVPFGAGNRGSDGMVLALRESDCGAGLKAITAALDQEPVLDGDGLRLALWMRERYFCTVYDSVKAILPAGLYYALKDCVSLSPDLDDAALEAACQGSAAAKQLLELVPEDLKKPELTASWEMELAKIAKGAHTHTRFHCQVTQPVNIG